jgi:NAD(P)-dependent dehydrogenase (short-subunit alcohol dehydrogenase family)
MDTAVAIVTGGNRGLGFACAKQLAEWGYEVVLCSRDAVEGEKAGDTLRGKGFNVRSAVLDIQVQSTIDRLTSTLSRVDVLVNCAGVYLGVGLNYLDITEEELLTSLDINAVGAWRMCKAVASFMIKAEFGRIINVTSGWGSLTDMQGNGAAYRISKTALNAVTRVVAKELATKGNIKVNAVCPGWVRTRMGGEHAEMDAEHAALDVLWPVTFDVNGDTGQFYRARQILDW